MASVGNPPKSKNPLSYTGEKYATVPVLDAPRRPTINDSNYPLMMVWRVGHNPLTGVEGEVWQLVKFNNQGLPVWQQIDFIGGNSGVDGPDSSTINALSRWDNITGTLLKDSSVLVDDSGNITGANSLILANPLGVSSGGTGQSSYVNGQLLIGNTTGNTLSKSTLTPSNYIDVTNGSGTITLGNNENFIATGKEGWNGSILESAQVEVTSNGSVITLTVSDGGSGDLTVVFSDGYYVWDVDSFGSVVLTAGTDTVPVLNYVYFLQSNKTLTASTSGWPITEYAPIATVLCQSAASLQTDGAYKLHAWTDHVINDSGSGHISDINYWIRHQNATWENGVSQTYTINTNVGTPDNVIFTTTSGEVLQLHEKTFPAFSGTPDIYVVNYFGNSFNKVTDLNTILTDSTGSSLENRFFSLVIFGCLSESESDCKLFCNVPSGHYNNSASATSDLLRYTDYSIPDDFKGTGFLISRWTLSHSTSSGGTWTSILEEDLRGLLPSVSPGGLTALPNTFDDSVFRIYDDSDATKLLAFQCSGISTATTRTLTIPDASGTIPLTFAGNSGTASATSAGQLTLSGGSGITTTASSNTVSISLSATNGIVYLGKASPSGASTAELVSLITNAYQHYILTIRAITESTDGTVMIQGSSNNGSSWITTGYRTGVEYKAYDAASYTNSNSTSGFLVTPGHGDSTSSTFSAVIQFFNLYDNAYTSTYHGMATYNSAASTRINCVFGGDYNAAAQIDALRVILSAGTITGEICLYGVVNS